VILEPIYFGEFFHVYTKNSVIIPLIIKWHTEMKRVPGQFISAYLKLGVFGAGLVALLMMAPQNLRAEEPDADWLNVTLDKCDECHSPVRAMHEKHTPYLVGQSKSYLFKQMKDFQKLNLLHLNFLLIYYFQVYRRPK